MSNPLSRAMAHVPFLGLTARRPATTERLEPQLPSPGASLLLGTALAPVPGAAPTVPAPGATAPQPAPAAATPPARAAEDEEEEQPADGKKGRKAKGEAEDPDEEEEDEEDREEMRAGHPAADARARERARCLAIFGHPAAAANLALAATLAAGKLGRHEACAILAAAPAAKPAGGELSTAMASLGQRRPGADAPPAAQGAAAIASSWDAAAVRAGVRRRA